MKPRLHDKTLLITGAAQGIGRAAALEFARHGARVVLADLNPELGEATAREVEALGTEAFFVRCDVSRSSEVENMVQAALERFGVLDGLYANAGMQLHGQDAPGHELEEEIWDFTMNVNLKGAWLCAKFALPALMDSARRRGPPSSLILCASPTGLTGAGAGYTAYSASKGGVVALTRVLAADYGRRGVRVNAVVPGPTRTPLIATLTDDPATVQTLERQTMLGRLGEAEDVTGLLTFLASDESSYCTGGIYTADGGITAL